MSTIHDDNATSWRDLADQLTPEQISRLENMRDGWSKDTGPAEIRLCLLVIARDMAQTNLADGYYSHVPLPAGAVKVHEWDDRNEQVGAFRYFTGTSRVVDRDDRDDDIDVLIEGTQYPDGSVDRLIGIHSLDDGPLTIGQARQLARALIAAADETEQMSGYDPSVTAT